MALGSGPQITAIVSAEDLASPVIQRLLAETRKASESTSKLAANASAEGLASMEKLSAKGSAVANSMKDHFSAMGVAMAAGMEHFGKSAIEQMLHVGGEMERIQRRMLSFTSTTNSEMEKLRRHADLTGGQYAGGPMGIVEGARAASMSGVKPRDAELVSQYGARFADETGEGNDVATEKLIQHMMMSGHLRDENGKRISLGEATHDQIDRGMRETLNFLISVNQVAVGKMNDVYEGFKFAGPTALGLGRNFTETAALYAAFSEHGIVGAEAGNTIKSLESRGIAPTQKGRQAMAQAGIKPSDYIQYDSSKVTEEGVQKGLEQRMGTLNAGTKAAIHNAVTKWQQGGTPEQFQTQMIDALIASGSKSVHSRIAAGNAARDVTTEVASTFDLVKFRKDMEEKGLGVGFANQFFGKEQGGRFMALDADEVLRLESELEASAKIDHIAEADLKRRESYDGKKGNMEGTYTGMVDRYFLAMSDKLGHLFDGLSAAMSKLAKLPEGMREGVDILLAAGAALGGLKAAVGLGQVFEGLAGLGANAAGIETSVGLFTRLAALVPGMAPLAAGLIAATAAFEIFEHRLELANWAKAQFKGDVVAPTNDEDANDLENDYEKRRAEYEVHKANFEKTLPSDPVLDEITGRLGTARADARHELGSDPDVADAKAALDRAQGDDVDDATVKKLRHQAETATEPAARQRFEDAVAAQLKANQISKDKKIADLQERVAEAEIRANQAIDALPEIKAIVAELEARKKLDRDNAPPDPEGDVMKTKLDNERRAILAYRSTNGARRSDAFYDPDDPRWKPAPEGKNPSHGFTDGHRGPSGPRPDGHRPPTGYRGPAYRPEDSLHPDVPAASGDDTMTRILKWLHPNVPHSDVQPPAPGSVAPAAAPPPAPMASLDPTRTRAVEKLNEALYEQSRRSAGEFRRDPEAARGRNRMANDGAAGVIAAPTSVDVKVAGQAEVHQTIALQVEPSNFFMGLVRQVENGIKVGLHGAGDMVGGGSGVTPPKVGPAFSGHSMR